MNLEHRVKADMGIWERSRLPAHICVYSMPLWALESCPQKENWWFLFIIYHWHCLKNHTKRKGESQMAPHLEKTEKREHCASSASYRTPAWAVPESKQRSVHCSQPLVLSHFTFPLGFPPANGQEYQLLPVGSPSPSTHTTGPGAAQSSKPKPRHSRFLKVMATDANPGSMCSVENPRQFGYS